jgi:hypothetical protein
MSKDLTRNLKWFIGVFCSIIISLCALNTGLIWDLNKSFTEHLVANTKTEMTVKALEGRISTHEHSYNKVNRGFKWHF